MSSKLDQLRSMTTVVADTGDVEAVRRLKPVDCTTNPSIVLKALETTEFADTMDEAIAWGNRQAGDVEARVAAVADRLAVSVGATLAELVPGRVSTEVDADLSFDTTASVARAQAIACADAGVFLISPFVGRISDWYVKTTGRSFAQATTGPLGQGVATSVGMAIAQMWLAATYNRPGFELFDYDVYAIAGDGCMMEGISGEAASLAGHLRLSNLCWIYDDNKITIEGSTELAFSEDVGRRFEAYGWNVLRVEDANDLDALDRAFAQFRATTDRPTFISVRSHIGYGSPNKQDTYSAHGSPLGEDEVRLTKRFYGWPEDASFLVPDEVAARFRDGIGKRGRELSSAWNNRFEAYAAEYPDLADQVRRMQRRELPERWDADLPSFPADEKGLAGRVASGKVLNALAQRVPWLIGGAADLAPSTNTRLTFDGAGDFSAENYAGRNFHFGVREHAMSAVLNGMSLSKIRAYGSGFLIFSDYPGRRSGSAR